VLAADILRRCFIAKFKLAIRMPENNEAFCYWARPKAGIMGVRSLLEGNKCCQKNKRILFVPRER
jgi:hypothetical protein